MDVEFVSDRETARFAGFMMLSQDGVSCIHPQYPGVLFQLVKNRTDVAACGGALVAFGANLDPLRSYRKLVFGADIAHHLDRADGVYHNIDRFPVVREVYAKDLGTNGYGYTGGNGATVELMHDVLVGFNGTRWVKGNFGNPTKAYVLGVHSRIARGFAWHMSGDLSVPMTDLFAKMVSANPKSTWKIGRLIDHPNGGTDASHTLGEKCLMVPKGNYNSENFRHLFAATGGEGFVSADFKLREFLKLSQDDYVADYPDKLRRKVDRVYSEKLPSVPEVVALSMPIMIKLPVNKTTGITIKVGRDSPIRQSIAGFERVAPDTSVSKEYSEKDIVKMGWWADESGSYPYGAQPLRPAPINTGWGNSYESATSVSFCDGNYSFFRAPNLALSWGPETQDADASTQAPGEIVINAATLFQALSPMAQPKGPTVYRSLNDFVRLASETIVQPSSTGMANSDPDSPTYLADAVKAQSKLRAVLQRDEDMLNLCEPFSRELYRFINGVNAKLM